MPGRMVIGALIASVLMMIWGFVFWAVLGNVLNPVQELADDSALRTYLSSVPESGVYIIPGGTTTGTDAAKAAAAVKHEEGPLATIFLRKEGAPVMGPMVFVMGQIHYFITALLIGIVLRMRGSMSGAFGFVMLIAVLATFALNLGHPIWFYHSWRYWLLDSAYCLGMFALGGLVMARFAKT